MSHWLWAALWTSTASQTKQKVHIAPLQPQFRHLSFIYALHYLAEIAVNGSNFLCLYLFILTKEHYAIVFFPLFMKSTIIISLILQKKKKSTFIVMFFVKALPFCILMPIFVAQDFFRFFFLFLLLAHTTTNPAEPLRFHHRCNRNLC